MKRRTIWCLILAGAMLASLLAGCAGTEPETTTGATTTGATTTGATTSEATTTAATTTGAATSEGTTTAAATTEAATTAAGTEAPEIRFETVAYAVNFWGLPRETEEDVVQGVSAAAEFLLARAENECTLTENDLWGFVADRALFESDEAYARVERFLRLSDTIRRAREIVNDGERTGFFGQYMAKDGWAEDGRIRLRLHEKTRFVWSDDGETGTESADFDVTLVRTGEGSTGLRVADVRPVSNWAGGFEQYWSDPDFDPETYLAELAAAREAAAAEADAALAPGGTADLLAARPDGLVMRRYAAGTEAGLERPLGGGVRAAYFARAVAGCDWVPAEEADAPDGERVELASADGETSLTVWPGEPEFLRCESGGETRLWRSARAICPSFVFAKFRAAFDLLERDAIVGQSFAAELTPEEAVAAFAEAYGAHLAALTPGNPYAVTEYHVLQSGIVSQTLDGSVVWGGFVCAAAPADADEQAVWSGEAIRTEYTFYAEQYGGMLLAQKSVILERQEDGAWRCLAVGEGQARFPQKMEWTDGGFTFDS